MPKALQEIIHCAPCNGKYCALHNRCIVKSFFEKLWLAIVEAQERKAKMVITKRMYYY